MKQPLTLKTIAIKDLDEFDSQELHMHKDLLADIDTLADNIRQHDVLCPILVAQTADEPPRYRVLDGWRRITACKHLGKWDIPAYISMAPMLGNDADVKEDATLGFRGLMLSPNLTHRKVDSKTIEEAVAFLHGKGLGYAKIATMIGYSKAGVQKIVARIELGPKPQKQISAAWRRALKALQTLSPIVAEQAPNEIKTAMDVVLAFVREQIEENQKPEKEENNNATE